MIAIRLKIYLFALSIFRKYQYSGYRDHNSIISAHKLRLRSCKR